jgi:hypothetical protein
MNRRSPRCSVWSGLVLVGLGAAVLAACSTMFAIKISDIKSAPSKFDGKDVTVEGKVTASHNLMVVKYYEVDDGSGEIPVVTDSALPKEGATVRVKGRVTQAFVLGTARLVVIVEQPPSR